MIRCLVVLGVLAPCLLASLALGGEDQSSQTLAAFLRANGLPANTIEQVLEQEFSDPYHLKGARVLTPYQVLKSADVDVKTIQNQYKRIHHAQVAIGISVLLAGAGVACLFVPIPGVQAGAVILIKQGVAVAATATAVAAGASYTAANISEVRSLKEIARLLQKSMNEIFADTPIERDIGKIQKVKLSSRGGIKAFYSSEGYDFGAQDLVLEGEGVPKETERVFVSYSRWRKYLRMDRWFLAEFYNDRVISLVDFLLYPVDRYKRMAVLDRQKNLRVEERIEYATLVARQIAYASSFRKDGWHPADPAEWRRLNEDLIRIQGDSVSSRYREERSREILQALRGIRATI